MIINIMVILICQHTTTTTVISFSCLVIEGERQGNQRMRYSLAGNFTHKRRNRVGRVGHVLHGFWGV